MSLVIHFGDNVRNIMQRHSTDAAALLCSVSLERANSFFCKAGALVLLTVRLCKHTHRVQLQPFVFIFVSNGATFIRTHYSETKDHHFKCNLASRKSYF